MTPSPLTWRIWADRRDGGLDLALLTDELEALEATVDDLRLTLLDRHLFHDHPPRPGFRDFGPFADLQHPHRQALQAIGAELLDAFGWRIDIDTQPDDPLQPS